MKQTPLTFIALIHVYSGHVVKLYWHRYHDYTVHYLFLMFSFSFCGPTSILQSIRAATAVANNPKSGALDMTQYYF